MTLPWWHAISQAYTILQQMPCSRAIAFFTPAGISHPHNHPQLAAGAALQPQHRHQLTVLDAAVEQYLAGGITLSTRASYSSALRRYLSFCQQFHLLQRSETTLCRFAASLGQQRLKHRTVKSYLSGLRFAHIHQGLGNPFMMDMPRLGYVLSGIKREQALKGAKPKPRLPITAEVLKMMKQVWLSSPNADSIMSGQQHARVSLAS
jgi:hypothetical protein